MNRLDFARTILRCGCSVAAFGVAMQAEASRFTVAEQPAQSGIAAFSRQAGIQLLVPGRLLVNRRTNAVIGDMDARAALQRLIEGTGLRIKQDDGRTVILGSAEAGATRYAALQLTPEAAAGGAVAQTDVPVAIAAGQPQPAAPSQDTGEILVTARRTSERLQDVPVAVTAFGGEALARRSIDTLDQVARYTPNIRFDGAAALSGGNYNATVFVRGVGQNDFAIFSDPGVGFYVDDVYYARSIGGVMDAIDLASVQVLRGPQGTLFGKNTIGGAVLITTGIPEMNHFSGKLEGTAGSYKRKDLKGYVNIPLVTDIASLRISAATLHRDGYVKRLFDGDTQGDRNANMVRAKLRVTPDDRLTIDIGGDYTRARETSAPSKLLAVGNVPGISGVPFLTNYNLYVAPTLGIVAPDGRRALDASYITSSPFTTYAGGPNDNNLDLYGFQGVVAYKIGGATLKSITAYRHMKAYFTRDGDNTPFTYRQTTNRDRQWQLSQELQLTGKAISDRLSYVLGGYYFKEKASDIATADLAVGLWPPLALTPPYSPAVFIQNYTNNRSLAAYGQADFELFPRLSISAGARYTSDRKVFTSINTRQRDLVKFIDVTKSATFNKFTPHFGINYKLDRDVLLYASYSKGFKQGGFNGRPLASDAEVTQYAPETLDSYEVGIKSQWLDHALTANLAVFHSIYKNIQLTVNQTPQNFVANAAGGKIDGGELELVARPISWFSANAAIGYLHARYTSIGQGLGPTQILPITLQTQFAKAPKFTATAGIEVTHRLEGKGELALRSDLSNYSRIYQDVANTPIITEQGYTLLNARLSFRTGDGRLEFAVFGTNLTNALYIVSGNASASFGLAEVSYGRPREWGASAAVKF